MAPVSGAVSRIAVNESPAIVVTSIFQPSSALRETAKGAAAAGYTLIVIGDPNSPPVFVLESCVYYDLDRKKKTALLFAHVCPPRHYARKNIGYLLAHRAGAPLI